jgi:hypothetical protein
MSDHDPFPEDRQDHVMAASNVLGDDREGVLEASAADRQ